MTNGQNERQRAERIECDVAVIGAGPGGYVCALRSAGYGLSTVIVDARRVGGTCLNVGCIPSKALIHLADDFHTMREASRQGSPVAAMGLSTADPRLDIDAARAWKDRIVQRLTGGVEGLLRKAKVRHIVGRARIVDGKSFTVTADAGTTTVHCRHLVLATGSVSAELPDLPFGGPILSSTQALELERVPSDLAVVGAGYIGMEIGTAMSKLGARVTVIETGERILPSYDAELTAPVRRHLDELGVTVHTRTRATRYDVEARRLHIEGPEGPGAVPVEHVMVAIGRRPAVHGWNLDALNLDRDDESIRIDARGRTSMRGVYAIGDLTPGPMLAHRAMAQGEMVADVIAGHPRKWDAVVPAVCFTDPEIVTVGAMPGEPGTENASFPFRANGRALTLGGEEGFVRVVWHGPDQAVLGIQAVGRGVSELASYATHAIEMGARLDDVASTVHAHPLLGEAVQEAALKGLGRALHL